MATIVRDKYYLRSVHEEIDLLDRKLAHLWKFEVFVSEAEQQAAANKLSARRQLLVRSAQQMIDDGVEYRRSELPRSQRTEEDVLPATAPAEPVQAEKAEAPVMTAQPVESFPSPFAGTSLEVGMLERMRARLKERTV